MRKFDREIIEKDDKIFERINVTDKITLSAIYENGPIHRRITKIKPLEKHYEDEGEPEYIKWCCPICEVIGNRHQVGKFDEKCMLCGINLDWSKDE